MFVLQKQLASCQLCQHFETATARTAAGEEMWGDVEAQAILLKLDGFLN